MPAPRFVNESQEHALWLSLSSLWAIGGTLAWLFSLGGLTGWNGSGSELTMLATFAAATTLALRLPILNSLPNTSLRIDHIVWLLTSFAAINWLGFFALQTHSWSDAIPVVLLFGLAETWFHAQVGRCAALPWLRESCEILFRRLGALGREPTVDRQMEMPDSNQHSWVERTTVQGLDEQGRRYLSGTIRVSLAAEQSTRTLSIAFSPPFAGEPDVDFEFEGPECEESGGDVSVYLIHSTPAGMRLGLRRTSSTEAVDFPLQWYAVEVELGEVPSPSAAGALP